MIRSKVRVFVDLDWAADRVDRKSTSGCAIFLQGAKILSFSRTQSVVATSAPEAESYAIGSGASEALGTKSLLEELGYSVNVSIWSDSSSGTSISSRLGLGRMKHVEIKYLFIQGLIKRGLVTLHKVATLDNCSDLMTKYLDLKSFQKFRHAIGYRDMNQQDKAIMQEQFQNAVTFVALRATGGQNPRSAWITGLRLCLIGFFDMLEKGNAFEVTQTNNAEQSPVSETITVTLKTEPSTLFIFALGLISGILLTLVLVRRFLYTREAPSGIQQLGSSTTTNTNVL